MPQKPRNSPTYVCLRMQPGPAHLSPRFSLSDPGRDVNAFYFGLLRRVAKGNTGGSDGGGGSRRGERLSRNAIGSLSLLPAGLNQSSARTNMNIN